MKTEERLLDLGKMIQDIVAHEVNVITDSEWFEDLVRGMVERVVHRPRFEAVKANVDIVQFAGRFTTLRPDGNPAVTTSIAWKGHCPLHEGKDPSFTVYPEEKRWRCYGACSTGGDVINLAQQLMAKGKY